MYRRRTKINKLLLVGVINVYLVLSRDANQLLIKINRVIKDLGYPRFVIRSLKEAPGQPEVLTLVPIYDTKTISTTSKHKPDDDWEWDQTTSKTVEDIIIGFEAFYNPGLYKEMLKHPNPTILRENADIIINSLLLLDDSISLTEFLGYLLMTIGIVGSLGALVAPLEKTSSGHRPNRILLILVFVLLGIGGFKIGNKAADRRFYQHLHNIENAGVRVGLFSELPNHLVESVNYIQLLESKAELSKIKSIIKLASTNPKKAIEVTTALVKQKLPAGSKARQNYLSLLKIAYATLSK
jgi:hypothetical protein